MQECNGCYGSPGSVPENESQRDTFPRLSHREKSDPPLRRDRGEAVTEDRDAVEGQAQRERRQSRLGVMRGPAGETVTYSTECRGVCSEGT